jgi:pyrimidine-nucleoside phosphorylase
MGFLDTIAAKRDGRENSKEQLVELAQGAADKSIPDYQLSAWLMAAYLNGLNPRETADLTMAMADSGERLDLSSIPGPHLDKHSTGGVGDKTTLVVLPILAACGVTMVKMSGRGLGITGGTIDKLESIPGFRTDLTPEEMIDQAKRIGIALSGQTPRLAPADGALYALRDVTGTVANISLITASILSKKIAGGSETVVLDVKCGSGSFMKTLPEAEALARSLVDTGKLCGLKVSAVITDMDQPLGMMVGNAMEVKEAAACISPIFMESVVSGRASKDPAARFMSLCVELAGHALSALGLGDKDTATHCVLRGDADRKFQEWMSAQGATIDVAHDFFWCPHQFQSVVSYDGPDGWVASVDAQAIGEVVTSLGGGRRQKSDHIDSTVGVCVHFTVGDEICSQAPVFLVHAKNEESFLKVKTKLASAIVVSNEPIQRRNAVLAVVH